MPIARTRLLLALWGQKLQSYLPPYAPAGLVGGHALMRFPVTGSPDTAATTAREPVSLDQLHAYVASSEWRASASPVEVVWHANESKPFCCITPASAEDVRLCTEYLLRGAADALKGSEEHAVLSSATPSSRGTAVVGRQRNSAAQKRAATSSTTTTPGLCVSYRIECHADISATLEVLADVVHEHRSLLAGAESLQTGVPVALLLAELGEAEQYLRWSYESRGLWKAEEAGTTRSSNGVAFSGDKPLQPSDDGTAAVAGGTSSARSVSSRTALIGESVADGSSAAAHADTESRLQKLRERFSGEVLSLQQRLAGAPICNLTNSNRNNNSSSTRSASADAACSSSNACAAQRGHRSGGSGAFCTLPLMTVVTSTHNSVASALKAAAVTWAMEAERVSQHVCSRQVLWRPAPETALAASWMMVLLRKELQRRKTAKVGEVEGVGGCAEALGPLVTSPHMQQEGASADVLREGVAAVQTPAVQAWRSRTTLPTCAFHVLLTGGDAAGHFIRPWAAGLVSAQGCNDAALNRRAVPLLCYGCPAAQVRQLRTALAHHRAGGEAAVATNEASDHEVALPVVVVAELRTEVTTTGVLTPASESIPIAVSCSPQGRESRLSVAGEPGSCETGQAVLTGAHRPSAPPCVPQDFGGAAKATLNGSSAPPVPGHSATPQHTLLYTSSAVSSNGVPSSLGEDVAVTSTRTPCADMAAVARDVFCRSVLVPPFRCCAGQSLITSPASTATTTAAAPAQRGEMRDSGSLLASTLPFSSSSGVAGWCSLFFVPQQHTAQLLRHLVQGHWREPWFIGHSLDRASRRGPAPSTAHVQRMQDVLRLCVMRGTQTPATTPSSCCPSPPAATATGAAAAVTSVSRAPLCWRHCCGGFPLPLTATAGRGSPYMLPYLLLTDLDAAMTAEERAMLSVCISAPAKTSWEQGRGGSVRAAHDSDQAKSSYPSSSSLDAPLLRAESATMPRGSACSQPDMLHTHTREAAMRAAEAVQLHVAGLVDQFEGEAVGFRGVVGGNFLFLCRYPDSLVDAVMAAVKKTAAA